MSIIFEQCDLDKIHSIQLKMLIELDRICKKYKINYIISGGTLLGAVRSGGFIPWDDDIDVRMCRHEYNRFIQVCENELDDNIFFLQNHKTDSNYPWYYGKLRYVHSQYTREGQEHLKMKDGIFIDIMPADGLPNNNVTRNVIITQCYILKKFLYSSVGCTEECNRVKRLVYKLANKFPKKIIFSMLDNISKKYMDDKFKYVTSYSFVKVGQKQFTEKEWHIDCVELCFEGHMFSAPREYHKWLVMTYGEDYMMLPPENKRFGHNKISKFYIEE